MKHCLITNKEVLSSRDEDSEQNQCSQSSPAPSAGLIFVRMHRDYLVDYLVLKQENLLFLEGLSDNASVPANCILSHSSTLYT